MQYVVCYDIADDARRSRVANALLDFGRRAQESVFLANLDEELLERMWTRVGRLVDEHADRLHVFTICAACEAKTRMLGLAERLEEPEFYVV